MTAERCPVCDRETCRREAVAGAPLSGNIFPYFEAHNDCENHRVDWRARAKKAEERMRVLEDFANYAVYKAWHVMQSPQLGPTPGLQMDLQGIVDRGEDALRIFNEVMP